MRKDIAKASTLKFQIIYLMSISIPHRNMHFLDSSILLEFFKEKKLKTKSSIVTNNNR